MNVWAKTLLSSYRYLERVASAIDKIVYTRAINSFFVSGQNLSFNSVTSVSDDILNLTERKVSLINLKIILDEALKKVSSKHSQLLISVFIECRNCYQSSEALNISLRTFFRRQNEALESFEKVLKQLGNTADSFDDMLKNENWILEIKSRYYENTKHVEQVQNNVEKKITLLNKPNKTGKENKAKHQNKFNKIGKINNEDKTNNKSKTNIKNKVCKQQVLINHNKANSQNSSINNSKTQNEDKQTKIKINLQTQNNLHF